MKCIPQGLKPGSLSGVIGTRPTHCVGTPVVPFHVDGVATARLTQARVCCVWIAAQELGGAEALLAFELHFL